METNLDIIIKSSSDTSGLDKLTSSSAKAEQSTKNVDKAQKEQASTAKKTATDNNGLATSFGSLIGKLTAAAAAYMSYNVLVKDAIALAGVQRKADANLMSALVNTAKARGQDTNAAQKEYEQIKRLSAAKQEELGIGDESLQQAARWFVSAGANIEQMDRLITVSADLAEVTNTDVVSSAKNLTKVFTNLSGSVGSLREQGVAFTDAEVELVTQLDKAGKKAEAQDLILKKLEATYGGSAKKAVDEFGGEFKRLKNTFGDFRETLGVLWEAMAAPAAGDLKKTFEGLIGVFTSPAAVQFVSTLSGVSGAIKSFSSITISPALKQLGPLFTSIAKDADNFIKSLANLGSGGAVSLGIIIQGFNLIGDAIVDVIDLAVKFGKAIGSWASWNLDTIKKAFGELGDSFTNGLSRAGKNIQKLLDKSGLEEMGREAGKAVSKGYVNSFNKTQEKINKNIPAPQPDEQGIKDSAQKTASLFNENLVKFMQDNGAGIQKTVGSMFDFGNAFSGLFSLGIKKEIDTSEKSLSDLEKKYASLYDTISVKQAALAEQEKAQEEQKKEREFANMEAELARLSTRTDAYLGAEEKKKWRELERNKEIMKAEKERAKEAEHLEKEKLELDKKLEEERANIKYAQDVAKYKNDEASFEANKQQNIFSASMAIAKAPIDGTLAILQAGAQAGLAGVLAMTATVTGLIASVISGAVSLASAANQSFNAPPPVKGFYTGGVVPLEEGNKFRIGGAIGMEEEAVVRGGNLYIKDALSTKNTEASGGGTTLVIGNMNVYAKDPEDFAEQMKNLYRREKFL